MVWYLDVPWDRVVIGLILAVIGAFQFWQHLDVYEHIYSPARARPGGRAGGLLGGVLRRGVHRLGVFHG